MRHNLHIGNVDKKDITVVCLKLSWEWLQRHLASRMKMAHTYTAHAVVLTNMLSQPLRQNVLFSP